MPDVGWEDAVCRCRRSQNTTPAMSASPITPPTTPPAIAPALVFFFDDDGDVCRAPEIKPEVVGPEYVA